MATLKFEPRDYQIPLLQDNTRFQVWLIHRRAGKTYTALMKLILAFLTCTKPLPKFAFLAPEGEQGELVAWGYLEKWLGDLPGIKLTASKQVISYEGNDAKLNILSLKDANRLRGQYFDGVVIDEFGDIDRSAWDEVVYPCLTDRDGWAIILGTPKGRDNLYELYHRAQENKSGEWNTHFLDIYKTTAFTQAKIEAMKLDLTPSAFRQEYLLDWYADVNNKYYLEFVEQAKNQGRINDQVQYFNSDFAFVGFDLGRDAVSAWFAQIINDQIYLFDYWEETNSNLDEVFQMLHKKKIQHGLKYHTIYLPHDAVKTHVNSPFSIYHQFKEAGYRVQKIDRTTIAEGIAAVQQAFKRLNFNSKSTSRGLECLMNYSMKVDSKQGIILDQPKHDQFSHGSDAMRYLILGLKDYRVPKHKGPVKNKWNYFDK